MLHRADSDVRLRYKLTTHSLTTRQEVPPVGVGGQHLDLSGELREGQHLLVGHADRPGLDPKFYDGVTIQRVLLDAAAMEPDDQEGRRYRRALSGITSSALLDVHVTGRVAQAGPGLQRVGIAGWNPWHVEVNGRPARNAIDLFGTATNEVRIHFQPGRGPERRLCLTATIDLAASATRHPTIPYRPSRGLRDPLNPIRALFESLLQPQRISPKPDSATRVIVATRWAWEARIGDIEEARISGKVIPWPESLASVVAEMLNFSAGKHVTDEAAVVTRWGTILRSFYDDLDEPKDFKGGKSERLREALRSANPELYADLIDKARRHSLGSRREAVIPALCDALAVGGGVPAGRWPSLSQIAHRDHLEAWLKSP